MSPVLDVLPQGSRRLRITGVWSASTEVEALEKWLAERVEVVRVERRVPIGAILVDYDEGGGLRGRLVRSLRDHLSALRPRDVDPFDVTPVHSLPGRVRVRVRGLSPEQLATAALLTAGIPGVLQASHLPGSDTILVTYDPVRLTAARLLAALRRFDPEALRAEALSAPKLRWGGAVGGTTVLLMCLFRTASFPWLATGVILSTLRPLRRSVEALREGRMSVDLLDVAGTFAALATGRPTTAAFVIWMVGVGDLLLDISASNARHALAAFAQRKEDSALRLRADGSVERVPAERLRVGDRFEIHTGHGVVADGRVVSGLAEVDEKALTGESRLVTKRAGDSVLAFTVVVEGQLVAEVTSTSTNTEAGRIERILATVGTKPLTLQRDALDVAGKLVLPTFGVAGLAALLSGDFTRAVCVLITDFGTGIRIAVPTSALTALALAAREGVLVKGAQYLERLSKTDVIVFDKTGTLTNGVPEVVEVVTAPGIRESRLIRLSASAEARHDHPVARALRAYAAEKRIALVAPEPGTEEYAVGLGLSVRVKGRRVRVGRASWMEAQSLELGRFKRHLARFRRNQISHLCVAIDGKVVGLIGYSDGTRPESAALLEKLRAGGKRRLVLLSGDSAEVVRNVAREVGIDEAAGALLPDQKASYVKKLQAEGHVVAMVGDGINDAPALAAADVGISIAGSTAVAVETADVILLDGGLARLEKMFRISDRALAGVRQSLGLIIAPNAGAIALGALGLITPPIAAVLNNGATLVAVLVGTLPLLRPPSRQPVPEAGTRVQQRSGRVVALPVPGIRTARRKKPPRLRLVHSVAGKG